MINSETKNSNTLLKLLCEFFGRKIFSHIAITFLTVRRESWQCKCNFNWIYCTLIIFPSSMINF